MRSGCAERRSRAPKRGFVSPGFVFPGLHWSSPAAFVAGMSTRPCGDCNGPTTATTELSAINESIDDDARSEVSRGAFVEYIEHELLPADTTLCVRLVDSQLGGVLQRRAQIRSRAGKWYLRRDRPWSRRQAAASHAAAAKNRR